MKEQILAIIDAHSDSDGYVYDKAADEIMALFKANMPSEDEIQKNAFNACIYPSMPEGEPTPDREFYDAFVAGAEWFRNRMEGGEKCTIT